MNSTAEQLKISVEDYLEGELVSDIKHEYINGEVYAMAGATRTHNIIAGNVFGALLNHLRGTPCRAFIADMKVGIRTQHDDYFYYPDVQVSCEKNGNALYNDEPVLIVEVLSDSTERKDRAEKFHDYRKLDSLQDYVLIAQDSRRVEIYSRETGWDLVLSVNDDSFSLNSVDLHLSLDEVYEDVDLNQ